MFFEDRSRELCKEDRITKYQHQHRGLNFIKLLLPPVTDRKVNLVGRDNHIYKGSLPRVPLDQLPPEVEETSIDEEALYKEIRDMNFPPVPEQEPLGPSRRIGGKYTTGKRMTLAPVHVVCTEELEDTLILGKDGGIYRGKGKSPSRIKLDKKLRGTKRPIQKVIKTSSARGYVEPSLVLLHTNDKPPLYEKGKKSLIELPTAEVGSIIAMIKGKRIREMDEATESKPDELQSEVDKASEMPKEFEVEADKHPEEQGETDTEISAETDTEVPEEKDTEIPEEKDAEISEETDAEISEETDADIPAETDTETPEGTDIETDAEVLGETDTEASSETDIKESKSEEPIESEEESSTEESSEESDT